MQFCLVLLPAKVNTSDVADFSERGSLFEDCDVRHESTGLLA